MRGVKKKKKKLRNYCRMKGMGGVSLGNSQEGIVMEAGG
jgi:hypothetical protein